MFNKELVILRQNHHEKNVTYNISNIWHSKLQNNTIWINFVTICHYLECLPGYFGKNCLTQCIYPSYGQRCQNTCDCNIKDCNHVDGCQGNHTQTETSTSWSTKHTSSKNSYKHTSKINEGTSLSFKNIYGVLNKRGIEHYKYI